jgi:hemoglobin
MRAFAKAAVLVLGVAGPAWAADEKPAAVPLDVKTLDGKVYSALRDVINNGADLYNNGDPSACYYLYRGALMGVQPALGHRPQLQKAVASALTTAEQMPEMRRRSFALRDVIDDVRAATAPTLWGRLGGEVRVARVVDDFLDLCAKDPKVNITRNGKYPLTPERVANLHKHVIAFISSATSGPIKYTGKDMKEVHKDMAITDAEFDAGAAALKAALEKNRVNPAAVKEFMDAVGTTRKDIVETPGGKGEEKKPEQKKPAEKKSDEKKSGDNKGS